MGRDDEWVHDEWIPGDEWIRGDTAYLAGYGETTAVPGVAWTTVWGHEAGNEAGEDEGDEDDWPDDDLLDDDWPDDESPDDEWLGGERFAAPGGPPGPGPGPGFGPEFGYRTGGWGHGGVPGFSAWLAVAAVAAVAGIAVGFLLTRGAPAASAAGGATPSAPAPASAPASTGRGDGPQARPGLPGNAGGNGDGQLRMLLTGRVLAVSGTSVTIGGAGPSVTAAVTSATKLTGRVHAIGGVKVGDKVAAEITGTPSHLIITNLQDPAQ
jgi:hypothetical protein